MGAQRAIRRVEPRGTVYPAEERVGEEILQRWIVELLRPLIESSGAAGGRLAYGLTPRERQVLTMVAAGYSLTLAVNLLGNHTYTQVRVCLSGVIVVTRGASHGTHHCVECSNTTTCGIL